MPLTYCVNSHYTYTLVIMTGGYGTRLQNLVPSQPKILAPIKGRPFLYYLLSWLRSSGTSFDQVILATGHLGEIIQSYVTMNDIQLSVIPEERPEGTFTALLKLIKCINNQHILVLNGDTVFSVDFADMFSTYLTRQSTLLSLVKCTNTSYTKGYIVTSDSHAHYVEYTPDYVSLGAFFISLDILLKYHKLYSKDHKNLMLDKDLLAIEKPIAYILNPDYFIDIGTPQSYKDAQLSIPRIFDQP